MTDSEITTTILRQIRDEIITTRSELTVTNERLSIVEHTVQDVAEQIKGYVQHVKTKQAGAIDDLRRRVDRLEKKVG